MIQIGVTVCVIAIIAVLALVDLTRHQDKPAPVVDTNSSVGKCIQAQRVLYQVTRGQAAEKCLADLDAHGPERFSRTWRNYETVDGSW